MLFDNFFSRTEIIMCFATDIILFALASVAYMTQQSENLVKKVAFERIAYSSAKKYTCEKGELILTRKNLLIECGGSWSKAFPIFEVSLEARGKNLVVYDRYGRLRFKVIIHKPREWKEEFDKLTWKWATEAYSRAFEVAEKRPVELKKLLNLSPRTLKKLYNDTRKEREQFERKNIRFNLDIQRSWVYDGVKNRKLKAFVVAHSYVAWYEWTKRLLNKIYKAKFGKGPKNDGELMKFLDDYPSWRGALDTTEWGIKANQIRNCVSHEKFYFDYKNSELVFMTKKEKRIRLRDLKTKILPMSHFYATLIRSLEEKMAKRGISSDHL